MITWELKITPIVIKDKVGSVVATRTDDTDPDNPMVYKVARAPFSTPKEQDIVWNEIRDKHLKAITEATMIDNFVSALENKGKTFLEAQE